MKKSMKKKLKLFLIIFTVIVLGAASYLLYLFKFKQYDVADEAVEEIMENPYTIELPDGTVITLDEEGTGITEGITGTGSGSSQADASNSNDDAVENGTKEDKPSSKNTTTTAGVTNNAESTKKPTVAAIKNNYVPAFEALQSQADAKLNALVGRAMQEYQDKQANGESIDFGYFFNKYSGAATALESRTDAAFHGVLKAVEKDLQANGYAPSYAKSFSDEYNTKKKARRDSLVSKALGR